MAVLPMRFVMKKDFFDFVKRIILDRKRERSIINFRKLATSNDVAKKLLRS